MVDLTTYFNTITLILAFHIHSPEFPALRDHGKRQLVYSPFAPLDPYNVCVSLKFVEKGRERIDLTRALC